jgi:hypothetical protein
MPRRWEGLLYECVCDGSNGRRQDDLTADRSMSNVLGRAVIARWWRMSQCSAKRKRKKKKMPHGALLKRITHMIFSELSQWDLFQKKKRVK